MRNLLAIKIQSCTDLITNSSSELFQLRTDKTVEEVSEALSQITYGYCEPVLFDLKKYREDKHKLDEMLEAITPAHDAPEEEWNKYWDEEQRIKEENPVDVIADCIDGWFFDPESPEDVLDVYKHYLCNYYNWNHSEDDALQAEFKKFVEDNGYLKDPEYYYRPYNPYNIEEEAFDKFIESHEMPDPNTISDHMYHYGSVEQLNGCILVLSADENSIPYDTWDTINEMFNGTNYHLG